MTSQGSAGDMQAGGGAAPGLAHLRTSNSSMKTRLAPGPGRMSITGESQSKGDEERVVYINPSSLASGGIAEKASAIFRVYDTDGKNVLEHENMMLALAELGVLNGLTVKKLTEILSIGSDVGTKGRSYSLQEFVSFYERLAHYQAKAARQERIKSLSRTPGIPEGAESNELIKRVFCNYCKYTVGSGRVTYNEAEPQMTSTQYVKLCQDLGLVQPSGPLNVVSIDVIFHKFRPQGGRRIPFPQFLKALSAAAEESSMAVFELLDGLGAQIKPAKVFVAPQPMLYRQETRSTEQSRFKVYNTPEIVLEESSDEDSMEDDDLPALSRRPRPAGGAADERGAGSARTSPAAIPRSSDEVPSLGMRARSRPVERSSCPTSLHPAAPDGETKGQGGGGPPALYSLGQGTTRWQLPADAPAWVSQMIGKMGVLEQQLQGVKQQVGLEVEAPAAGSRSAGALPGTPQASAPGTSSIPGSPHSGNGGNGGVAPSSSGAQSHGQGQGQARGAGSATAAPTPPGGGHGGERGGLLGVVAELQQRLQAVEGRGAAGAGAGKDGATGLSPAVIEARLVELEAMVEEELRGERTKAAAREDMKRLAKSAASAATKGLPGLEQRVVACETREGRLEQGLAGQAGRVEDLEGRLASLAAEVQAAVAQYKEQLDVGQEQACDQAEQLSSLKVQVQSLGSSLEAKVQGAASQVVAAQATQLTTLDCRVKALAEWQQQQQARAAAGGHAPAPLSAAAVSSVAACLTGPGGELELLLDRKLQEASKAIEAQVSTLQAEAAATKGKLGALDSQTLEQGSRLQQLLTQAQNSSRHQAESDTRVAALEAKAPEWAQLASSLEASMNALQRQVKQLQGKNEQLETEVHRLKSCRQESEGGFLSPKTSVDGTVDVPRASGPSVFNRSSLQSSLYAGSVRRGGAGDAMVVADVGGRLTGLETQLREQQQGLMTALAAAGISADAAMRDSSAAATAAAKRASQEAQLTDFATRLQSMEVRQQEAAVTLKRAEAMLGAPTMGLAALGAANAAAASVASDKKALAAVDSAVRELRDRVSSLEAKQASAASSLQAALSAAEGVHALQARVNTQLPELQAQARALDLAHKTLANKLPELETFVGQARNRLPDLELSNRQVEARVQEQEHRAAGTDHMLRELGEMVKLVQAEQEGFASNAAMAAQLRSPGGAGSSGGGSDGSAMALMLGSEERLQRSLQQVKDLVNANIAELDGAKAKYDTSLELVQVTFQQLHTRLAALESSSGSDSDSRLSSWARASELRELENSFIDRLRMTSDANERMQRTINQLVVDMERVAVQHNNSEHARANAASAASGARGGSLNAEQLGLMEQRVEQRLALMATQFASVHSLRECEARFASLDTIRSLQDTARANDELVLGAVKQLERQFQEKIDVEHQVLLRMARQVDTLQREIRSHTEAPQAEVSTPQLRLVRPLASPTGTMGFNPLTNAMGDRGQDPMSILLAQANGMSRHE